MPQLQISRAILKGAAVKTLVAVSLSIMAIGYIGCTPKEGPAERAGKKIDNAVDDASESAKSAREKAGEKIKDLGDRVEHGK